MRTLAVLPVKSFGSAKQRLGEAVAADERRGLAEAMALDVLDALAAVRRLDGVIVVAGANGIAADVPPAASVELVHDVLESGQSAAAALGVRAAVARGAARVLLVPGDCPALEPGEVDDLL